MILPPVSEGSAALLVLAAVVSANKTLPAEELKLFPAKLAGRPGRGMLPGAATELAVIAAIDPAGLDGAARDLLGPVVMRSEDQVTAR